MLIIVLKVELPVVGDVIWMFYRPFILSPPYGTRQTGQHIATDRLVIDSDHWHPWQETVCGRHVLQLKIAL